MSISEQQPLVISYLRFSCGNQEMGDSSRRQLEKAERWCQENGYTLCDRLEDRGISAFRGKNTEEGKLSELVQLAQEKKIPKGTILLVEELDRVSRREPEESVHLFMELVRSGVTVVTLNDGQTYKKGELRIEKLMLSVLKLGLSHEESAKKQARSLSNWEQKRLNAKEIPLTARLPFWLKLDENRQIVKIHEMVEIVRRIFQMALEGMGGQKIVKVLNQEAIDIGRPPDRKQCQRNPNLKDVKPGAKLSHVVKTLQNRAVLGEFQPGKVSYKNGKRQRVAVGEVLKNYFPKIIDEETFFAVKAQRAQRTKMPGGANSLFINILSGILFTPKGASMYIHTYDPNHNGERRRVFASTDALNKKEKWVSFPHQALELAVLNELHFLLKKGISPEDPRNTRQLEALEGEIIERKRKIDEIKEAIIKNSAITVLIPIIGQLDSELKSKENEREALLLKSSMDNYGTDIQTVNSMVGDYISLHDLEKRRAIRQALRRLVERVEATFRHDGIINEANVLIILPNGIMHRFNARCHRCYPWQVVIRREGYKPSDFDKYFDIATDDEDEDNDSFPNESDESLLAFVHDLPFGEFEPKIVGQDEDGIVEINQNPKRSWNPSSDRDKQGFRRIGHPKSFFICEMARDMYRAGWTASQIAKKLGFQLERAYYLRPREMKTAKKASKASSNK